MSHHKYFFQYDFDYKKQGAKIYLESFKFGPYFNLYIEGSRSAELSPVTLYPRGIEAIYSPLHKMLSRIYENDSRWWGPKLFIVKEMTTSGKVVEQILFTIENPILMEVYKPKSAYHAYVWEFNR